jgi:hypothetical protein
MAAADPEWWLIDEPTQNVIARSIDAAADSVIAHFDRHANENSITAAFGQTLLDTYVDANGTSARFSYRNFPEQSEEKTTGADGSIVVSIRNGEEEVKKAVLFQAKRLPQHRPVKSLTLPRDEAGRLRRQLDRMVAFSDQSIVLIQTRERMYAVDAVSADELTIADLVHLTAECRLVSLGTFLGKWVTRCSKGDQSESLVARADQPGGFLRHHIRMTVVTDQPPLLTAGGVVIDPVTFRGRVPRPRWQR